MSVIAGEVLPPARAVQRVRAAAGMPPPIVLVVLAMLSVQVGAAIATHLFSLVGPPGAVLLRTGFAAVGLILIWRPRLTGYGGRAYALSALFGLAMAVMNLCFYSALDRIPLGIAVTLEFAGPLAVAVAGSRRALDLLWVVLAAAGILLLAPVGGSHLDPLGVLLALAAGTCWAGYILLGARVGQVFPGGAGLVLALAVGTIVLAPMGAVAAGSALLDVRVLGAGAAVALLSSAIPYSLELEALRRLPTQLFGVLMSLEPAIAALVGFAVLRQALGVRAVIAIVLVTVASIGASRFRSDRQEGAR